MASNHVLRVNAAEEETAFRDAVFEVIRRILAENELTLIDIAERIDVSLKTISNAFNKKHHLCQTYLNRLGRAFGPSTLDPIAALSGGRMIPLEVSVQRDILPFVQRVGLKIAVARSPEGPGGARETHREKADYVPDLRALRKELDCLIHQIESELAA